MASKIKMGKEVFNIPFADIIREVAMGIADAQFDFDKTSMLVAEQMSGLKILREADTGEPILNADGDAQTIPSTVFFGYDLRIAGTPATANLTIVDDPSTAPITTGTINLSQVDESGNLIPGIQGSLYDYAPKVEIIGDGQGAKAIATLTAERGVQIQIDDAGSGYTQATLELTGGKIPKRVPRETSMIELGFVPNFYQFVDTVIEMKLALRINRRGKSYKVTSATVDANYASSFNYALQLATTVKTKIVPIPPPVVLEDRIRQITASNEAIRNAELEQLGIEANNSIDEDVEA